MDKLQPRLETAPASSRWHSAAGGRGHTRRPQLTLDELYQLKWLLGGVVLLLAVGTVFYMDIEGWTLMAIIAVATVAATVRPALPARVPQLVHTLAFPAIVAFFAVDLWTKAELLPAMVRLDMLLLLYRSITYRQRRDDLQVIVLGLFLIVIAGVLSVSLTFAVHILLYTGCALAFLLIITLAEAAPPRAPNPKLQAPGIVVPGWAAHANWSQLFRRIREVTDWRVLGLGVVLFAGVVGLSGLLFLAIPRFQFEHSMFLDRLISKKSRSGFSETIQLGDVTDIQQDNSVALSVDVSDHTVIPATPYWRMLVLDQYRNGTFRLSATLRQQMFEPERSSLSVTGTAPRGAGTTWTFYLESGVSRFLPLLTGFEQLRFREVQTFQHSPGLALVALRQEPVRMTAYQVEDFDLSGTLPDPRFASRWRARAEAVDRGGLQVSGVLGDPDRATLARLVNEITGGDRLAASDFAQRAGEWLRQNHGYSLSPRIPAGDGDLLVRWVASREAGHCELFAGSLVLLARTAGFPARVVTGFKGGTWNGYSKNFTIRNSDAHAWTEIFDETIGAWLRADPLNASSGTAAEQIAGEAAISSRLDRSWSARVDSLRVFWYRRIVSFDQRSQQETLRAVKEATESSGKHIRAAVEQALAAAKRWITAPWNVRRFAHFAGLVAALVVTIWIGREFGRAWWRRLWRARGLRREDPVRREAGEWLRRMYESRDRIQNAEAVTADLQRLRFGARETWSDPDRVLRRARRVVREARRRRHPV